MKIKDQLCKDLTAAANEIIAQTNAEQSVWANMCTYDEAGTLLKGGVPPYIAAGSDLRVVKLTEEDDGCPCGGTHVKHVNDIQEVTVTKIIKKGKNTRVSYTVK